MYRLLLVDDEKQITEGLKYLLAWGRYQINEIREENTYEGALRTALVWKPHIAIMDVCIGDKYGYDLHREIKAQLPELCVVMISGHDEFSYAREAIRQGAVDYLLKPVDRVELAKVMEGIIVNRLRGSLPALETDSSQFDEVLGRDCGELSKLVRKIIQIVHEEYGKNLTLSMLAERLEVSNGYLGKVFSKETGMKFSQYLMMYRMKVAKELLSNTDYKVSYVASRVGYTNRNYFYTHFQLCYGKSPTEFRDL